MSHGQESPRPRIVAIIAAGGQGRRFGAAMPKQLLEIAGRTILEHSVRAFALHPAVDAVVVALPAGLAADPPSFLRHLGKPVRIVDGGGRRQDSVANAFAAAASDGDVFVIHDAARPLVDADTIGRTIAAAIESGAAIAAVPARDTIKLAAPGVHPPSIAGTIDRDRVWLAQTPQAFSRAVLADAIERGRSGATGTDEAALAEQAGHAVRLVEGDARNLKITTLGDLALAASWMAPEQDAVRIGTGYDSHRLVEGRPLVLGGVTIPYAKGLAGHSDADALCHAITDAVLGAAALGDIGRHFPDTDVRWKGADSLELLRQAVSIVRQAGFAVSNVDAVVVAEQPKLAPHVDAIRARLAGALGTTLEQVSVKGKTNEGMGEAGRGEGIVVHAVAAIRPLAHGL
jgi:2-C-methyl-D-erythritol 4-phosphate cytidylyltransferase/2-C-methyl-D-erythritol 2,4-cyclodiphosphate synthase